MDIFIKIPLHYFFQIFHGDVMIAGIHLLFT